MSILELSLWDSQNGFCVILLRIKIVMRQKEKLKIYMSLASVCLRVEGWLLNNSPDPKLLTS